jgi:NAD(P)-dependent dehydrogenase (short-subunit alcohol dehydrogenase family)
MAIPSNPTPGTAARPLDERIFRLNGRVAAVTGGGGGIGSAICERFARVGARVACLDLDLSRAQATAERMRDCGGDALGLACDVASEESVAAAVREISKALGSATILVNTAAYLDRSGTVLEIDLAEWDRVHRVNLTGAFLMSREVLPGMIAAGGGSIIHVSSMYGWVGGSRRVAYTSTKGALLQLARSMANDHASDGIRVNTLSPGAIETERVARHYDTMTDESRAQWIAKYPMKRFGSPDEVATAALFLASEAASFVTGADIKVDGGYCAV